MSGQSLSLLDRAQIKNLYGEKNLENLVLYYFEHREVKFLGSILRKQYSLCCK